MVAAHRIGLALTLATGLLLGGCGTPPDEIAHGWMTNLGLTPKAQHPAGQRHKIRVVRRSLPNASDPDVTGSVPLAAKAEPSESAVLACSRRLYLKTASSIEEIRVAEEACRQVIVNQPYGGAAQ